MWYISLHTYNNHGQNLYPALVPQGFRYRGLQEEDTRCRYLMHDLVLHSHLPGDLPMSSSQRCFRPRDVIHRSLHRHAILLRRRHCRKHGYRHNHALVAGAHGMEVETSHQAKNRTLKHFYARRLVSWLAVSKPCDLVVD